MNNLFGRRLIPSSPHATADHTPSARSYATLVGGCAGAVALAGGAGLAGWVLDVGRLRSVAAGLATMKVNTALCFVLAGAALWWGRQAPRGAASTVCAAVVAAVAALTLAEYVAGLDLGIDQLVLEDRSPLAAGGFAGRMSAATAVAFLMASVAVLALDRERAALAPAAATACGAVGAVALVGYTYDVNALYAVGAFSSMAVHTSVAFVLLSLGLLFARPDRGLVGFASGAGSGPAMVRRLVPWAVAVPVLTGWLRIAGERAGLYPAGIGTALLVLVNVVLLVGVIGWTARGIATTEERLEVLAARDRLYGAVVESTDDAVVVEALDGTITGWNPAAERLYGYTAEEAVGRPIDLIVPADRQDEGHRLLERIGRGERLEHFDTVRANRDGTPIEVSISLSPVKDRSGAIVAAVKIARDITERKRRDDELLRSNAELEQFAYVASHDLQEPLRMVASYTELLGRKYRGRLDEKADKYIHYAVDGAKRMQRLVADLLVYSRVGSQGKPLRPVDSGAMLAEVVESLGRSIRQSGGTVEAVSPLPTVLADQGQLGQLLQNLVGNALKFKAAGRPPHVEVEARRDDGRWRFAVRDNGIGIDPEHGGRIFQMFQRLHEAGRYEGSGIGLAISRRIVERHGGKIWFESEPGEGATFYFTLPGAAAAGAAAEATA